MAGMDFFIRPATGTGSADWIRIPNADIEVRITRRLTRTIIRGGEGDNLHDEGAESTIYTVRGVLMSSGIGLEATVHSISQGGYGIISEDFSNMMDKVRKGGRPLAKEIKSLMGKVETDGYRRLLNIMHMNITQNTDIIETLKKQGSRMEEERTEDVKKYIEDLSGVPESLLSIGMIGPIILAVLGLFPQ